VIFSLLTRQSERGLCGVVHNLELTWVGAKDLLLFSRPFCKIHMTTLQVHTNTTIITQWSVVGVFFFGHCAAFNACEEFESHRQNGHKWPVPDKLQNT